MFDSDQFSPAHDVFHSPSSVAICTPVKEQGLTDKRHNGGLGCAKRLLPRSDKKPESVLPKSATPASARRHKVHGHYMQTTEASRLRDMKTEERDLIGVFHPEANTGPTAQSTPQRTAKPAAATPSAPPTSTPGKSTRPVTAVEAKRMQHSTPARSPLSNGHRPTALSIPARAASTPPSARKTPLVPAERAAERDRERTPSKKVTPVTPVRSTPARSTTPDTRVLSCPILSAFDEDTSSPRPTYFPSTPSREKKSDSQHLLQQLRSSPSTLQAPRAASPAVSAHTLERRTKAMQSPARVRGWLKNSEEGRRDMGTPPRVTPSSAAPSQLQPPSAGRGAVRSANPTSHTHTAHTAPKAATPASSYSTPMKSAAAHRTSPVSRPKPTHHSETGNNPNPSPSINRTPSRPRTPSATLVVTGTRVSPHRPHSDAPSVPLMDPETQRRGSETSEREKKTEQGHTSTPLRNKKTVMVTGKSPAPSKRKAVKRTARPAAPTALPLGSPPVSASVSISCIRRVEEDDELSASTTSTWGLGLSGKFQMSQSPGASLGTSLWEGELQQMSLLDFEDNEEQYREERRGEEEEIEWRCEEEESAAEQSKVRNGSRSPLPAHMMATQPIFDLTVDMDEDACDGLQQFKGILNQSGIDPELNQSNCCLGDSFYQQQSLPYEASLLSIHIPDDCAEGGSEEDDQVLFGHTDEAEVDGGAEGEGEDSSTCSSSSTVSVSSTLRMVRRLRAAGVDQSCLSPLDSIRSIDFSSPSFREEFSCVLGNVLPIEEPEPEGEGDFSFEGEEESTDTRQTGSALDRGFVCHRAGSESSSESNNTTSPDVNMNITMMANITSSQFSSFSSRATDTQHASPRCSVTDAAPHHISLPAAEDEQRASRNGLTTLQIPSYRGLRAARSGAGCPEEAATPQSGSPVSLDVPPLAGPESALSPTLPLPPTSMPLFSPGKGQAPRWGLDDKAAHTEVNFSGDVVRPRVKVSKYARSGGGHMEKGMDSNSPFSAPSSSLISVIPHGTNTPHLQYSRDDRYSSRSPSPSPRYISMESLSMRSVSTSPQPVYPSVFSPTLCAPSPFLFSSSSSFSVPKSACQSVSQSVQDFLTAEAAAQIETEGDIEGEGDRVMYASQSTSCSTSILNKAMIESITFGSTSCSFSGLYNDLNIEQEEGEEEEAEEEEEGEEEEVDSIQLLSPHDDVTTRSRSLDRGGSRDSSSGCCVLMADSSLSLPPCEDSYLPQGRCGDGDSGGEGEGQEG